MSKKANLTKAKSEKNDEFYTQLSDIENEVKHYKGHFKGKTIFLNCDDPEKSMFWKYFQLNFNHLGLKKLIATHFESSKPSYKLTMEHDLNGDGVMDEHDIVKTPLKQNGDFRSDESIELLKECDIVVTNPPFSLFREYIAQLMEYDKKFLVVGTVNAVTYKEIFPLIKNNKLWAGVNFNKTMEFMMPDTYIVTKNGRTDELGNKYGRVPAIAWYTNLDIKKRHEDVLLHKKYTPEEYPKYDNYEAINVNKVVDIPLDYTGEVGVPITFLNVFNPSQFELVKFRKGNDNKDLVINGKTPYFRIIIKRK